MNYIYKAILRNGEEKCFKFSSQVWAFEKEIGAVIIYNDGIVMPIYKDEDVIGVILRMEN